MPATDRSFAELVAIETLTTERLEVFSYEKPECFMRDQHCAYPELYVGGAQLIVHNDKIFIACSTHARLFTLIDPSTTIPLSEAIDLLRAEIGARSRGEREFRDYIKRHLIIRDSTNSDLVTDEHIDLKIRNMTPENLIAAKRLVRSLKLENNVRPIRAAR